MSAHARSTRASRARRGGLLAYFLGAYILTWLFWIPAALAARGEFDPGVPDFVLLVLGGLGPMLAAILVSGYKSGRAGVRALFGQLLRWRVSTRWYALALLGIAALELSVVAVRLVTGGSIEGGALLGALAAAPFHFLFVALVGGGLDEEMGWRGYALPRAWCSTTRTTWGKGIWTSDPGQGISWPTPRRQPAPPSRCWTRIGMC